MRLRDYWPFGRQAQPKEITWARHDEPMHGAELSF